ncbi:MAG TPA: hypothetical protein VGA59_06590 [Ramlibacter sp.]
MKDHHRACKTCACFEPRNAADTGGTCHRHPQREYVERDYWCMEHRPKADPLFGRDDVERALELDDAERQAGGMFSPVTYRTSGDEWPIAMLRRLTRRL